MTDLLSAERRSSKLQLEQLTNLLDGGKEATEKRRRIRDIASKDPLLKHDDEYFLTDEEFYERKWKITVRYIQLKRELGLSAEEEQWLHRYINLDLPIGRHNDAFIPTIEGQGTEEQKAKWLPLAKNYYIIGTYAQTEMGHGTFIRGLETTSTYDPSTQEFVLNSPTLTSLKWWPGSIGHDATHAAVMARLITKGTDHGVHPFIVQLRSLEDHTPLPGVEVGDIGPTFGWSGGNGFLRLTSVRIPREHMLMRFSQVSVDGTYSKPPFSKMSYGSMVFLRAKLVTVSASMLSKCVTIATRYSVVRRQTQIRPGEPETQVMDYQTQQYKLLPLIATTYAMLFTGKYTIKRQFQVMADINGGNLSTLPEHHATCAGLKAYSAEICSQGMEVCRLSCGGHGYSQASGIPSTYASGTAIQTAEGEGTVMYLQTARYLLKTFSKQLSIDELPANVSYLGSDFVKHSRCPVMTSQQLQDPHVLLDCYRQRIRRLVEIASARFQEGMELRMDQASAWNYSLVDLLIAAKAHCHYVVLLSFNDTLQESCDGQSASNMTILRHLFSLYGVYGIIQNSGEFGIDGYLSTQQLAKARESMYSLLDTLRPEAVPLVDAFDWHDDVLNSCLGRYDGDVYTHLYEWAKRAPRNKTKVHPTYDKYLRNVLLKSKL